MRKDWNGLECANIRDKSWFKSKILLFILVKSLYACSLSFDLWIALSIIVWSQLFISFVYFALIVQGSQSFACVFFHVDQCNFWWALISNIAQINVSFPIKYFFISAKKSASKFSPYKISMSCSENCSFWIRENLILSSFILLRIASLLANHSGFKTKFANSLLGVVKFMAISDKK